MISFQINIYLIVKKIMAKFNEKNYNTYSLIKKVIITVLQLFIILLQ